MVKFGKNKFKALNKLAKNQKTTTTGVTNKILKKKQITEKKVSFQKEVLLKEAVTGDSGLVKNLTAKEVILNELSKKPERRKVRRTDADAVEKPKQKPIQKKKKRQKTQIQDTKFLLNLMKKK